MKITVDAKFTITLELNGPEVRDMSAWMRAHTGAAAPSEFKELLAKLNQIEEKQKL